MAESSECIILILGHGDYNTRTPDYKPNATWKRNINIITGRHRT